MGREGALRRRMTRIRRNNRNELIYTRKPARAQQHKLLEPQFLSSFLLRMRHEDNSRMRPGNPRLAGRNWLSA